MSSAADEYQRMSERLRNELSAAVRNGDELFLPSSEVRREAVQFIRPRSRSLTFIRLTTGTGEGRTGDGVLNGIGMSSELVEYLRSAG